MTGLSVRNLLEPVQELMRSDLIGDSEGRLTFRHDLIRDGVRAACSVSVRRALDRQAAGVLLERGACPVDVALQLAQSAEPGDIDAVSTLLEAAESLAVTDPAASANLAMKGLDLAPRKHPTRGPLVSRAAVSLFVAGRTSEAMEFADVALRQTLPPEQEAEVRLGICRMFLVSPDVRTDSARKALALPDFQRICEHGFGRTCITTFLWRAAMCRLGRSSRKWRRRCTRAPRWRAGFLTSSQKLEPNIKSRTSCWPWNYSTRLNHTGSRASKTPGALGGRLSIVADGGLG